MLHVKVDIQTRRSFMCITALQCVQSSTYHISSNRADLRVFRPHWHSFFRSFLSHAFCLSVSTQKNAKSAHYPTNKRFDKTESFYSHHWHTPDELDKKYPIELPTKTTLLAWEYFPTYWRCCNETNCKQLKNLLVFIDFVYTKQPK